MDFSTGDENSNSTESNLMKYEVDKENEGKSLSLLKNIEWIEKEIDNKINFNTSSFNNSDIVSKINFSSISSDLRFLLPIYISCSNCKENFSLKIHNFKYMTVECGCKLIKNCTLNEFITKYCSSELINYGCKIHYEENKPKNFIKYCKDCKVDLCQDCLNSKGLYNNDTGKHKAHEVHDLIDLLDNKNEIEDIKNLLKSLNNEDNNKNDISIKNLIIALVDNYEKSPSYYAYKTIKIIKKFIMEIGSKNSENTLQSQELKIINSIQSLKENINFSNVIYKIQVYGIATKESLYDLNIFENKGFEELKSLKMYNIKLKDIKALSNCFLPNLKKLIIQCNELNDDCIEVIKKMNLPKIKFISFFDNKITSPEIFGAIEKFETLEKFFIGQNLFDLSKLQNKNIKYNFPTNLAILGLTNNFTKETNKFIINNLNIENIKYLYLSGDGFITLKDFEKIEFKRLEEFFIKGNKDKGFLTDIKEIKFLKGKKNIEKIVLKQNKINNIEELVDIINLFPNLKLLNIEDNDIEKGIIEKVIAQIKIKGFEKLKIIYN